jgi:hypothetical protein
MNPPKQMLRMELPLPTLRVNLQTSTVLTSSMTLQPKTNLIDARKF